MKKNNISNKEWGYIFGLLKGDGYLFHDKKGRHYYLEFYLNSLRDKKVIEFIKNLLGKMKLRIQEYKDKRFNCIRIRTYSKDLYGLITKDDFTRDDNFKLGFISGFIDSDGYYSKKNSTLAIINTNLSNLKETKKFLEDLGIKSSLNKKFMSPSCKKQAYNLYISVKFISLQHLSKKITYHSGMEQLG